MIRDRFATARLHLLFGVVLTVIVFGVSSAEPREPSSGEAFETTAAALEAFADPAAIWGEGIEAEIERAYRQSFQTYMIDGSIMTLQMPFAQNFERQELAGTELIIYGDGKADPRFLWDRIDEILESADFQRYLDVLGDGREKVVIFDLPTGTWRTSTDLFDLAGMKAGSYRGLPHRPYVYVTGDGVEPRDVYNYLYGIGRVGMDCSGFVWHILTTVAEGGGVDLGRILARTLGVRGDRDPSFYVGTQFFDSNSQHLIQVEDYLHNLRPGDVMLFRSRDGRAGHSAIIQSVDMTKGVIRYLQSTDEAPQDERGVHDSYIYFDPERRDARLSDPELEWSQQRFAPFPGEYASAFSDDGERYRADFGEGGGKVVRLRAMVGLFPET
ncbi:MAG: peptidoglycan endopeptidase [Alkalispirochaeta sp.]